MLLQALLLQLKFDDGDDDHDHHHDDVGGDGDDDDDDDDDDMKYEWVQNPPEATPTTHFLCQEARFSSECQYYNIIIIWVSILKHLHIVSLL